MEFFHQILISTFCFFSKKRTHRYLERPRLSDGFSSATRKLPACQVWGYFRAKPAWAHICRRGQNWNGGAIKSELRHRGVGVSVTAQFCCQSTWWAEKNSLSILNACLIIIFIQAEALNHAFPLLAKCPNPMDSGVCPGHTPFPSDPADVFSTQSTRR